MGFLEKEFLALNSARYFQIALKSVAQFCIPVYHSKVTKSWPVPLGWKNLRKTFSSEHSLDFFCLHYFPAPRSAPVSSVQAEQQSLLALTCPTVFYKVPISPVS